MRESVVFYRSFYEAVKELPPDQFKASVMAIMEYGLNDTAPESNGIERTVYLMAKPQIDANNRRYKNGTKGGRPITNIKPNNNQSITKPEPKEKDKDKEKVNVKDNNKTFTPPSVGDVSQYCESLGYRIDAEAFIDFYSSKGWMVGKNKMKDWKAAVRNWNRGQRQELTAKAKNRFNNFSQRDNSDVIDRLESM